MQLTTKEQTELQRLTPFMGVYLNYRAPTVRKNIGFVNTIVKQSTSDIPGGIYSCWLFIDSRHKSYPKWLRNAMENFTLNRHNFNSRAKDGLSQQGRAHITTVKATIYGTHPVIW